MRYTVQTLVLIVVTAAALAAQSKRTPDEENTISIFKQARSAVVHVNVGIQESSAHGDRITSEGLASGFLIDRQGRILTNYHVVEQSNRIEVYLPCGRRKMG